MNIAILISLTLFSFSCEENPIRQQTRPASETEEIEGYITEVDESVKKGQAIDITLDRTTVSIPENSLQNDAQVRLRRLSSKPERSGTDIFGDAKGDIIELTIYNKKSGEIFGSEVLGAPYGFKQNLDSIEDFSNIKYIVVNSPNTEHEEISLISNEAITESANLIQSSLHVQLSLSVTHAIVYGIESAEESSEIVIISDSETLTSEPGGVASQATYELKDSWENFPSQVNTPSKRFNHSAIWTGSNMIVWGGQNYDTEIFDSGGVYDPAASTWEPTSKSNAPAARMGHTAVWTGSAMIIWGGDNFSQGGNIYGGIYEPSEKKWTNLSEVNAPSPITDHSAVWTGSSMIIWGGKDNEVTDAGGIYQPTDKKWELTEKLNAPRARANHSAVWSGTEMIVWGGEIDNGFTNTGGRLDPISNTWQSTSTVNAPVARANHSAIWTGDKMIIWGGSNDSQSLESVDGGGIYDPKHDSWKKIDPEDAPVGRIGHTTIWTGLEMVVFGGRPGPADFRTLNTGFRFNPTTGKWSQIEMENVPSSREQHTAIWSDTSMIVWGGINDGGVELKDGGHYK